MDKDYTIKQVVPRDSWTGKFGTMNSWALKLEGVDDYVQISQKPETPAPEVGGTLHGHTETSTVGDKTYLKFKKVNPNYSGDSVPATSSGDLKYITQMLEELTGRRDRALTAEEFDKTEEKEDITKGGDDFDLSEIPF